MMSSKQSQKAGDNSQQLQADNITIINGIDEKRAREIFDEKFATLKDFTLEALNTANARNEKFSTALIKRMDQENALAAFSDPSFQLLLVEAQRRAASTERIPDYDLLSELLLHRFKRGSNRIIRAGISRAVEIVDQISDESLLGLSVLHAVSYFLPVTGNMSAGLKVLDNLFDKLFYSDLPTKGDWLDHLDILDAARLSSIGGLKRLEDYWYEKFDGYIKNGIQVDSEKYNEVKKVLSESSLSLNCLVKNEMIDNHVRINVVNKGMIPELKVVNIIANTKGKKLARSRKVTENEIEALNQVYDMYDGNKLPKEDFINEIDKYPNLKKLREWWNMLNVGVQITSVGKVLAHANAQRIDSALPPLD